MPPISAAEIGVNIEAISSTTRSFGQALDFTRLWWKYNPKVKERLNKRLPGIGFVGVELVEENDDFLFRTEASEGRPARVILTTQNARGSLDKGEAKGAENTASVFNALLIAELHDLGRDYQAGKITLSQFRDEEVAITAALDNFNAVFEGSADKALQEKGAKNRKTVEQLRRVLLGAGETDETIRETAYKDGKAAGRKERGAEVDGLKERVREAESELLKVKNELDAEISSRRAREVAAGITEGNGERKYTEADIEAAKAEGKEAGRQETRAEVNEKDRAIGEVKKVLQETVLKLARAEGSLRDEGERRRQLEVTLQETEASARAEGNERQKAEARANASEQARKEAEERERGALEEKRKAEERASRANTGWEKAKGELNKLNDRLADTEYLLNQATIRVGDSQRRAEQAEEKLREAERQKSEVMTKAAFADMLPQIFDGKTPVDELGKRVDDLLATGKIDRESEGVLRSMIANIADRNILRRELEEGKQVRKDAEEREGSMKAKAAAAEGEIGQLKQKNRDLGAQIAELTESGGGKEMQQLARILGVEPTRVVAEVERIAGQTKQREGRLRITLSDLTKYKTGLNSELLQKIFAPFIITGGGIEIEKLIEQIPGDQQRLRNALKEKRFEITDSEVKRGLDKEKIEDVRYLLEVIKRYLNAHFTADSAARQLVNQLVTPSGVAEKDKTAYLKSLIDLIEQIVA